MKVINIHLARFRQGTLPLSRGTRLAHAAFNDSIKQPIQHRNTILAGPDTRTYNGTCIKHSVMEKGMILSDTTAVRFKAKRLLLEGRVANENDKHPPPCYPCFLPRAPRPMLRHRNMLRKHRTSTTMPAVESMSPLGKKKHSII